MSIAVLCFAAGLIGSLFLHFRQGVMNAHFENELQKRSGYLLERIQQLETRQKQKAEEAKTDGRNGT